jgi:hypothetical protein
MAHNIKFENCTKRVSKEIKRNRIEASGPGEQ